MKKLVFALVAMMITTCSFAQAPQGGFGGGMGQFNPEDMAKRQADQLKTTCELNDEQYKKVNLIIQAGHLGLVTSTLQKVFIPLMILQKLRD